MNRSAHATTVPRAPERFGWASFALPLESWLAALVFVATVYAYSQAMPLFYNQDEIEHTDLAWGAKDLSDWPDRSESVFDARWEAARESARAPRTAEAAIPRGQRPSLDDLALPGPGTKFGTNNAFQHPPLYYALVAVVTTIVVPFTGDWSWMGAMGFMRLLSVAASVLVPLAAAATVLRLTGRRDAAVTAALLPLLLPALTQISGAVNNDNLVVPLCAVLTLALTHVVTGDDSRRTAGIVGAITAAAVLTKGTALFAIAWVVVAYVAAARLAPAGNRSLLARRGALAALIPTFLGGWWFVRNFVELGTPQPSRIFPDPPADFVPAVGTFFRQALRSFRESSWANFTGGTVAIDPSWAVLAVIVVGVGVALWRGHGPDRVRMLALVAGAGGLLVFLLLGAWSIYTTIGMVRGTQGRYLFPVLVVLVSLAGVGLRLDRARWVPPVTTLAAVVATHAYVITRFVLPTYWGTEDATLGARVDALLAWSPWPLAINVAVAVAWVAGVVGVVVVSAIRFGPRQPADGGTGGALADAGTTG